MTGVSHTLALSPGGNLFVETDEQAEPKLAAAVAARLVKAFEASGARGLELLVSNLLDEPLPPAFCFWRGVARRYFTALCHLPGGEATAPPSVAKPEEEEWSVLVASAPPMKGLEYLDSAVLARLWDELDEIGRAHV